MESLIAPSPRVSVVMPVFNGAATVEASVRSLMRQTFEDIEVLVVDDGSTDGSAGLIEGFRDSRIRLLRQEHLGLVAALNHGCAEARGEYIARLDADDTAHERRIAAQVDHLTRHPQLGLLGTWAKIVGERGQEGTFEPPVTDLELRHYLLWDNPFVHSSVMFRRVAAQQAGGYPEGLAEEYRLWIRLARTWRIENLPEILVTHHVHAASYTGRQRRTAALRGRLTAQWEAAVALGTWPRALPALAMTSGAYLVALLGGGPEARIRERLRGFSRRSRGYRDARTTEHGQ